MILLILTHMNITDLPHSALAALDPSGEVTSEAPADEPEKAEAETEAPAAAEKEETTA
jgi:translation initiation factor 4G